MLPAPPKKLFGRENDLKILQNAFTLNNVIYIYGQGGIGKTTLISKLLYNIHQKKISDVFYVNIPRQIDYSSFLSMLLSKYFIHTKTIEIKLSQTLTDEEKLDYFIELLQGASAHVCIDNLHHLDMNCINIFLEKLLTSLFDVTLLILSRSRLPELSAHIPIPFIHEVKGISPDDAYEQLTAYQVNQLFHEMSSEKLQRFTGGNPLFIQQLISFAQRTKTPDHAFEQTSESFLEYMLFGLETKAKEILHALSFFQFAVPFSAFAKKEEHKTVLQLVQFNLISVDTHKHYFLHDLLSENIKFCFKKNLSKERIELFISYFIDRIENQPSIELVHETINFLNPIFDYQYQISSLQILLKKIISISISQEYPIDIMSLYKLYISNFQEDHSLSIMVGIYLFETDQPEKALSIYKDICDSHTLSVQNTTVLSQIDYFTAFANFYTNINDIQLRKDHELILYRYITQLFYTNQQDYGMSLLASMYVYISWYGLIEKSDELKNFAKQLLIKIEHHQIHITNEYQIGILLSLLSHLVGLESAKKIETLLGENWKPMTYQSPQKYNLYCQHLWSYLYITGQYKKERKMIDNIKESNISVFNTSQKIDFFAMMFRAFSFHGLFSEALSYHDMLFSYSKQISSQETYIFLAMYLVEFYIQIGWNAKAKEILDEYSEKNIPSNLKIFTELHLVHYYLSTYNTSKALFILRSLFKKLKNSNSWWNETMAHFYLIKTALLIKPHPGIKKLIQRLLENHQTPFRIQMLSRLALSDYHFKMSEFENAQKELSLLRKISQKYDYTYMMYLADELSTKVYLTMQKYMEASDTLNDMESLWKELKNENIPSRIALFKSIIAVANNNTEFAHDNLVSSFDQADTFGNEILTKEYLAATKRVKEIAGDTTQTSIEVKRNLDIITYTITQRHLRDIEEIISLFPKPRNFILRHAPIDDGSTIYNFEKPTQKIIIDTEFYNISLSKSGKKADFSKHEKLFTCFMILAESFPDYITKEQLFVGIWKMRYSPAIHNNNIHVAIQRLRQQLKQAGIEDLIITTQDGYKLSSLYEYRFMKRIQKSGLNQRQINFLEHAEVSLSKEDYASKYQVSLRTAHTDLQELLSIKKVKRIKKGNINYYQVDN